MEMQKRHKYPKVAIVIISYNHLELLQECIESIRKNNSAEEYELIVVDNASGKEVRDWLKSQSDLVCIMNGENAGFPKACNQGIEVASKDADILLLNNDTLLYPDSLYRLQEGLYQSDKIGAAGSVSNSVVNYQQVTESFDTMEEWERFAQITNAQQDRRYEKKAWLVGFALLLKREAIHRMLEKEGATEVLDTRFTPGNYEDNDLSIRLLQAGYQLLLCHNSFIYHYGGRSFGKDPKRFRQILEINQEKLKEKYKMDLTPYSKVQDPLVQMTVDKVPSTVLQLDCGLGTTLSRIQWISPKIQVVGTEKEQKLFALAQNVTEVLEEKDLVQEGYDVVLLDQTLPDKELTAKQLKRAKQYVKKQGRILVAVNNVQCIRRIEQGCRLQELIDLANEVQIKIADFQFQPIDLTDGEEQQLQDILMQQGEEERPLYVAKTYFVEFLVQ